MKIIVKSGVGQPVNPHENNFTGGAYNAGHTFEYHEFNKNYPPLPCYLPNGEVCPDGEHEGDVRKQYIHDTTGYWVTYYEGDEFYHFKDTRQIYLCKSDTEADFKEKEQQNSPEYFKAKAIEKLTSLSRRYKAFPESCSAIELAIEEIKAL